MKRLTTDFDTFSGPVNSLARVVTSSKKPEYEFETSYTDHWKSPPPTRPMPSINQRDPTAVPLRIGQVFGSFTVVGCLQKRSSGRTVYLVRCKCGDYEGRTAHDLRCGGDRLQHRRMCFNCLRWENVKSLPRDP